MNTRVDIHREHLLISGLNFEKILTSIIKKGDNDLARMLMDMTGFSVIPNPQDVKSLPKLTTPAPKLERNTINEIDEKKPIHVYLGKKNKNYTVTQMHKMHNEEKTIRLPDNSVVYSNTNDLRNAYVTLHKKFSPSVSIPDNFWDIVGSKAQELESSNLK